ncbi:hypothetical protein BG015_003134, partial [Linnemannia schmuckeri]
MDGFWKHLIGLVGEGDLASDSHPSYTPPAPPVDAAAAPYTLVDLPPVKSLLLPLDLPDSDGDVEEEEEEEPMSIAAATGLVAGGAFTSYTTVYADEYDRHDEREHDRRHHYHDNDKEDTRSTRFRHSPSEHHRFTNRHSLVANEEELLPGLLYVALA